MLLLITTALTSWGVGFPVRRWLVRWNIIDQPNARSSHTQPIARGGGLGIMIVLFAAAAGLLATGAVPPVLPLFALLVATLIVATISFCDDLKPRPAWLRFGCHALAAAIFATALGWPAAQASWVPGAGLTLPVWLSSVVLFLWLAGYANAFNFMDGINGLAAGQAMWTGAGTALIGGLAGGDWAAPPVLLAEVVAGVGAGFLPHNFPQARMFMGDVSSASLGFVLAGLAVWLALDHGWWLLIPLGLLHANFVLDTGITLARRILRKERWMAAHREHFYQRLIRTGRSHSFVTGWEWALQGVVLGLMLVYVNVGREVRPWLAAGVVAVWLVFFWYAEQKFRRTVTAT